MAALKKRLKGKKGIPEGLRGAYAKFVGGKPDKEGVTYIPQEVADIVAGEQIHPSGYLGTAFALDPMEQYHGGFAPNQQVFMNQERLQDWMKEGRMNPRDIDELLRGHELGHADSLVGGSPVGNRGYVEAKRIRPGEETTRAGVEQFVAQYPNKDFREDARGVERAAQIAGIKRMMQQRDLRRIMGGSRASKI